MSEKKNILSIDYDDDNENYGSFLEHLDEDMKRNKNKALSDIEQMGETYLLEIEEKKKRNEPIKDKYIKYILKKTKNRYTEKLLKSYSLDDVRNIYNELKSKNKFTLSNIFKFLYT